MGNHSLGIDTAFATMSDQPTHILGILGQPNIHGCSGFVSEQVFFCLPSFIRITLLTKDAGSLLAKNIKDLMCYFDQHTNTILYK